MEYQNHERMVYVMNDHRPIGVFDSGIGGITVLRELVKKFPHENFIYLGDTARLPYGTKSAPTVRKYSEQNMNFLISKNVKALVVACNTASTQVSESFYNKISVYNVIDPGSKMAAEKTKTKKIAVLATRATVKANTYEQRIKLFDSTIQVFSQPCPLFVSLAEEGWHDDPITDQVATRYLSGLVHHKIDTIVLGCTHYPLLKKSISKVFNSEIILIDSGTAICQLLENDFNQNKILRNEIKAKTNITICLTDEGPQFEELSLQLLAECTHEKINFELVTVI